MGSLSTFLKHTLQSQFSDPSFATRMAKFDTTELIHRTPLHVKSLARMAQEW